MVKTRKHCTAGIHSDALQLVTNKDIAFAYVWQDIRIKEFQLCLTLYIFGNLT